MCLGFLISANHLKIDLEKIKAILEWHTPENVGEVRSFHGLASFYRKFIRNVIVVGNVMTKTMRGDKKDLNWMCRANKSFESLKHKVVKLPILDLPNFNKVFQVECDASGSATGAVLSQEGKPIDFFSEKLNDAKRKYFLSN